MTIGFLGLGTMGAAMARHLLDEGHDLVVWNRTPSAADELVAAGAHLADTPAEALAAPVSISMLANDAAAEAVLAEGNLAGGPGRLHIAMSSLSPAAADRLLAVHEAAGVAYLAAPVLGRWNVAAEGNLNIIAAGSPEDLATAAPYFEVIGKRTWVVGDRPRQANIVKAAVNYDIIHAFQAIAESMTLVEANGMDGAAFAELLSSTLFPGPVYTGYGDMIAHRRYSPPGFTMTLGAKDLGLAEAIALEAGVELPSAPVLRRVFDAALADPELNDADWAAMAEITRRQLSHPDAAV